MSSEVKRQGDSRIVGNADTMIRLFLMDMVIKPSLLCNTETWINITVKEEKEINKSHYQVIRRILEQKESTPYYGLLAETGQWPYSYVIIYKRLMFFHHLVHSNEKRVARQIIMKQVEEDGAERWKWYSGVKQWLETLKVNKEDVFEMSKSRWKELTKKKMQSHVAKEIEEKMNESTKLRFIKDFGEKKYVAQLSMKEVKKILEIRLNMIELKCNFKGKYTDTTCPACNLEDETTEHVLECKEYQKLTGHSIDPENKNFDDMEWLRQAIPVYDLIQETRKWLV